MIRLQVIDQVFDKLVDLDTFGNENINLTLQVDDVRNIENKNASYSKDFNLPATKNNNKFFEHYYNVDRYNLNFNPYKNVKAFLYSEDVLVLEGFLRLVNVVEKSTEITYNVVLFNDVANIIETLADSTIRNLDFSDIAHPITADNIANSQTATGVTLTAGGTSIVPFYPLINNGLIANNSAGEIDVMPYEQYILNIQLKYIIDKIFTYAGFTYSSEFFDSTLFSKIYFDTTVNTDLGDDNITNRIEASVANNIPSGGLSVGYHPAYDFTILQFDDEEGDDNDDFNQTTCTFIAPYDCVLKIYYRVRIESTFAFGSPLNLSVKTVENGVPNYLTLDSIQATPNSTQIYQFQGEVQLAENMTCQIGITAPNNALNDLYEFVNIDEALPQEYIRLDVLPYDITQDAISDRIGDIKLADILKDVSKLFNLTFESVGNNTLNIEPYSDFISNDILNWSDKVNINEAVIEPIEIPKRVIFKHAEEEEDYHKSRYAKKHNINYGLHALEFDVDSTEVTTIETTVFSAPYVKRVGFTNAYLQHITKNEDGIFTPYDNKPRLVFKRGVQLDNVNIDCINFFNGSVLEGDYANATMYDDTLNEATANTNSLLYGLIDTYQLGNLDTQPTNTLFNNYWFEYINEKYNVTNGLILKVEALLTPTDLSNFSFAKKVKIQDQLYRVNKIEFNTDRTQLAKIELLRI